VGTQIDPHDNSLLVNISTAQTLAPNYNELIQISDFITAI